MEPEILKYRLKKNYTSILKDIEPRKILSYLYQDDIIDEDDMDEVRAERTRKRQAMALLSILSHADIRGYDVLVKALSETQPHLARLLKTRIPGEDDDLLVKNQAKREPISALDDIKNMMEGLYTGSQGATEHEANYDPATHSQSITEKGLTLGNPTLDQNDSSLVKPTQIDMISKLYRPHLMESVYKMTSSPRGLAVVVNMNKFESTPKYSPEEKLEEREGSELDAEGLIQLFTGLDFGTEMLIDLTKDELISKLVMISKYDFSMYDCFALCIMSHGKENFFYAHDGGKIEVSSICKMFNNANCKTLCGKPKLFFIQACRGAVSDYGTTVKDGPSGSRPSENEEPQNQKPKYSFNIKPHKGPTTAEHADILMAYSSVEGYSSYRNTQSGSRFIRSLREVFKQYACMEDVESMLTRVIKNVNLQGDLSSKQVPKPETTLTKKVFFWPGIKFD